LKKQHQDAVISMMFTRLKRQKQKLRRQQKTSLDEAVRAIVGQPEAGETKVDELVGVQVYKFHMGKLLCLIFYRVLDENTLKLLMVGPQENFYRDLKRTEG
jgi:hypothetical protein